MRQISLMTGKVVIFSLLVFSLAVPTLAAEVTASQAVTLTLPNGINLTLVAGSTFESLTVNDNNTLTLVTAADSDFTIQSANGYALSSDVGTLSCIANTTSQYRITGSAGTHTITISTANASCIVVSTGGTGGGGGGTAPAAPTGTSISISAGATQTESVNVTLTLAATNASTMLISNKSDFSDVTAWSTYAASKAWVLTSGVGTKTVYVKFRSAAGGESTAINDTIALVAPTQAITNEITNSAGGTVSLSDNKVSITVPANAFTGNSTITITPSTTYTAPAVGNTIIGSRVYDMTAKVGTAAVTTFSKALTLTFIYTTEEIAGIDESKLSVQYWDTATSKWVSLGGTVDAANNKITVTTTHFTQFAIVGQALATAGTTGELIKLQCAAGAGLNDPCKGVYYLGADGKRHVFVDLKTYMTWYSDFSNVRIVSATELASYKIGKTVTYRPGTKMIKINTDPIVYAVAANGTLRKITSEAVAKALYGNAWATQVQDISEGFFSDYVHGADIAVAADFDVTAATAGATSINVDRSLTQ